MKEFSNVIVVAAVDLFQCNACNECTQPKMFN